MGKSGRHSINLGEQSSRRSTERLAEENDGGLDERELEQLYGPDALNEETDPVTGVSPAHYADIAPDDDPESTADLAGSTEFAVIAFWRLDSEERFECFRFFIVPVPLKREIQNSEGTKLD